MTRAAPTGFLKDLARGIVRRIGYEVVPRHFPPASFLRPVGDMKAFLEDIKARGLDPRAVLDVGVWRAEWSQMAASVFPDAEFYLVEPLNEHPELVEQFLNAHPKAHFFQVAAGAIAETRDIRRHPHSQFSGSSFYIPDVGGPDMGDALPVPVVLLDDLVASHRVACVPDLVKLDVQGFELEVLRGATSFLGATEVFILEVSLLAMHGAEAPLLAEVIGFMEERNYVAYDLPGFHRRPRDGVLAQVDIAFVKADSTLRAHQGFE